MKTTLRLESNLFAAAKSKLDNELDVRLERAANDLRTWLRAALDAGVFNLESDTRALAESLYVQDKSGDDYGARLSAAATAYLAGGYWTEPVREFVAPNAYTDEHFLARVAGKSDLSQEPNVAKAAVATMLAWGFLWELGHANQFTGKNEHRPWMQPGSEMWAVANMAKHFEQLL